MLGSSGGHVSGQLVNSSHNKPGHAGLNPEKQSRELAVRVICLVLFVCFGPCCATCLEVHQPWTGRAGPILQTQTHARLSSCSGSDGFRGGSRQVFLRAGSGFAVQTCPFGRLYMEGPAFVWMLFYESKLYFVLSRAFSPILIYLQHNSIIL